MLAYPTTGSLSLQAEDRLRLFRFPLTRDTLPLLASAPIRVNGTGGILTLWLIKLRGTDIPRTGKCGVSRRMLMGFDLFVGFFASFVIIQAQATILTKRTHLRFKK